MRIVEGLIAEWPAGFRHGKLVMVCFQYRVGHDSIIFIEPDDVHGLFFILNDSKNLRRPGLGNSGGAYPFMALMFANFVSPKLNSLTL